MKLFWTPVAVTDLKRFLTYVTAIDPHAASLVLQRLERMVADLASIPEIAERGIALGTLECAIPTSSYILVYRVIDGDLQILSVRDAEMWIPPEAYQ